MTHKLKTLPEFFTAIETGFKNFEIRKNDRGFKCKDTLILQEYNDKTGELTGRQIEATVKYITAFEQKPGFVVMAIDVLQDMEEDE